MMPTVFFFAFARRCIPSGTFLCSLQQSRSFLSGAFVAESTREHLSRLDDLVSSSAAKQGTETRL
jgi:hypothetical protein